MYQRLLFEIHVVNFGNVLFYSIVCCPCLVTWQMHACYFWEKDRYVCSLFLLILLWYRINLCCLQLESELLSSLIEMFRRRHLGSFLKQQLLIKPSVGLGLFEGHKFITFKLATDCI